MSTISASLPFEWPQHVFSGLGQALHYLNPLPWIQAQRDAALQSLLSDHSWMLNPETVSAKIKYVAVQALSIGRNKTDSYENALPRLPTPTPEISCEFFLQSVKPILSESEYRTTRAATEDFLSNHAARLQQRLLDDQAANGPWLPRNWERKAYLEARTPLTVTSDYYALDMEHKDINSLDGLEHLSTLVTRILSYFHRIRNNTERPILIHGIPLSMEPARRLASAPYQKPGLDVDTLQYSPDSRHVIVLRNNRPYRIDVFDEDGGQIRGEDLLTQLQAICADKRPAGPKLGTLTAQGRREWAQDRKILMEDNAETIKALESATIVLCLDGEDTPSLQDFARKLMHQTENRFFGPLLQFVVRGKHFGGHFAHGAADATVLKFMMEAAYGGELTTHWSDKLNTYHELPLVLPPALAEKIPAADKAARAEMQKIDIQLMDFDAFGKLALQKLNVSPDSFIQMAVQLAYHRLYHKVVFTYETAATSMFHNGRTETIRTTSEESRAFVEAFDQKDVSKQEKAEALRLAISAHKQVVTDAHFGKGCDRHLLALREMAGNEVPDLFTSPGYQLPHVLSTSQTPTPHSQGGGFPAVTREGIGVSYNPQKQRLFFHITSRRDFAETSSEGFAEALRQALSDMKSMLEAQAD